MFVLFISDEEAILLGRKSIFHATHRDAYSGGFVNVYHIKEDGWVHISRDDCFHLYQQYEPEKSKAINQVDSEERKEDEDGDAEMS